MNNVTLNTLSTELSTQFQEVWQVVFVTVLPKILIAVLIFILGWLIAVILGKWVAQIIDALQLDKALKSVGTDDVLAKAGFKLNAGAFLGGLVRWFIIVVFLIASLNLLGLAQVNDFLRSVVLSYLPRVFAASLILLLAAVVADAAHKVIAGSARAVGSGSAKFFGGVAKWAIWVSAIMVALNQLGIGGPMLNNLFTGIVAMLSIAGGLAFGLGGKDAAARYIEKLREDIHGHN